jgi:hypothetical protein
MKAEELLEYILWKNYRILVLNVELHTVTTERKWAN